MTKLVANLRADLHKTSSRDFGQMAPADFMPGATRDIEDRVEALIAQGYNPAAAAAIATSKQPKGRQIQAIDSLKGTTNKGKRTAKRA